MSTSAEAITRNAMPPAFTRVFLRKEVRELAIYVGAAAALFTIGYTYLATHIGKPAGNFDSALVSLVFFAAVALVNVIATAIFTRDFSTNTMARLLAQPVPRAAIWNRKMLLLAACMGLIIAIHLLFFLVIVKDQQYQDNAWNMCAVFAGMGIFIFCTGPMVALLVRQGLTALLATMLTPFVVLMAGAMLRYWLDKYSDIIRFERQLFGFDYYWWIVGGAWSAFAYWFGRRTFLRLEV